ncbi:MAG: hypothetical protein DRG59_06975 [Deltaproteobacteria bacterium]|nr:MAG: hypothetical protein DRG83_11045 [Deltaproteobacteria bacterium]RLB07038.1 MAG: hypothetical protein DRG59_06975 [Deltaproteobacteria bacterium]HEC32506.1 hypothetical protein [Deltaproteobacteria bacterium]
MYSIQKSTSSNEGYLPIFYSSPSTRLDEIDYTSLPAFASQSESVCSFLYRNLINWINTDWSSIWPLFEVKSDSSLLDEFFIDTFLSDLIEYDVLVFAEPRSRKKIRFNVRSVRKGTPCIVEPEGF